MSSLERESLTLGTNIYEKCNNAIIISGIARSGTSILGKIIHSFRNVEYAYEPPMVFSLFPLIYIFEERHWKLLYETYLYEDLLAGALSGRRINCNLLDDSSIYVTKPNALIKERLSKSFRKQEVDQLAKSAFLAYKAPDIIPFLAKLKEYYPGSRIIVIVRKAVYVINSLQKKGWFADKSLLETNSIWPFHLKDGLRVPFWVDAEDADLWCRWDELHRAAYYYIRMNQKLEDIPDCLIIRYDDLIEKPMRMTEILADRLNLVFGEKTAEIARSVLPTRKSRDMEVLSGLNCEIREKVEDYSSRC